MSCHDSLVLLGQLVGDGVALHLYQEVLSLVVPLQLSIALCHTHTGFGHYLGLFAIEACGVREGAGSLEELSLLELCLTHEHPCMVQEGVVLLLGIP